MSDFIQHLLSRHTEPDKNVKPRVRGRFEPATTFSKAHTGDSEYAPDVINETSETFLFPDQNRFTTPAEKQMASTEPPAASFPKVPEENNSIRNAFLKNSLSTHPLPENDPATLHEKKMNASNQITPTSFIQPTGQVKPEVSDSTNNEADRVIQQQTFSKPHIESREPGVMSQEKAATTISNPHAVEIVKPALRTAVIKDAASENRNDVFQESFNQPQWLRDRKRTIQQEAEMARPVIKVTIGRIDVRAVVQSTPSPVTNTTPAKPRLSLEDYLRQRNNTPS